MSTDMKWTEAQQQAISRRGGTVLVSAAAGSGKTSVLVRRIIEIITNEQNPIDADKLLVVTYTNAAASQMAARIKKELEHLAADNPENSRLKKQAFLLGRAQISTVHSFCVSLLRENFNKLDIPVDFVLADNVVAADMRRRALEQTINELYADQSSGIEGLCDLFGRARSDQDTANLIERLYDFETNLAFPKEWEARVVSDIECGAPVADTILGNYILDYAKTLAESARDMISQALELCSDSDALQKAYAPALGDDFVFINSLLSRIASHSWDETVSLLSTYSASRLGTVKGDEDEAKSAVKELRNKVKDIIQKKLPNNCFVCTGQEYADDMAAINKPVRSLFGAVALFEKNLNDIKLSRRVFEFCDLERLSIKLLCDETGLQTDIARQVSERFEHVLVDEYQDTNEIQDLIFKMVSRDEKNLFFVGDIKQSIYGFRRADPEIFLGRRDVCHDNETGLFPAKIALAHNFRSAKPVIDAINSVFLPIMSRRVGGTDYSAAGEQLAAGENAPDPQQAGLELHLVDGEKELPEPDYVAALISDMLKNKYPVLNGGETRPCRESDFCVLLRSAKGRAKEYVRALREKGVRSWTDGDDNFFGSSEIAVMLSLMRVVDNPRRSIELAAVMMSPLFGFSADDMARLRISDRRASLYSLLLSSGDEKVKQMLSAIKEIRTKRNSLPTGELIQFAGDSLGAEIALCAGEGYSIRQNNLRLLIEYAAKFSASSDGSLASFLRVCEIAARGSGGFGRDFSPPSDAVCVTTVHKSKGLEWPVVIVANAEKQFNFMDSKDPTMLFDSTLGIGSRMREKTPSGAALYSHKTLGFAALALASNEKTTSEEMRVLYVALTRARQKLIVTAAVKNVEKTLGNWRIKALRATAYSAATAQSWLDWIGLSLASLSDRFTAAECGSPVMHGSVSLTISGDADAAGTDTKQTADAVANPELVDAINRRAGFVYDHRALCDIPGKLSVTDLSGKGDSPTLYRPAFLGGSLSAAARGSAIHLFMQCADYKNAAASLDTELQRLVAGQYIAADDAASINKAKLHAFFQSELGQKVTGGNVLREYEFIDSIDASVINSDIPPELAETKIMLQGIADCIILEEDGAILVDYKSDRVSAPEQLVERYKTQISLYRAALAKQLPIPIKSSVIYSFALSQAIEVPGELPDSFV